MAKRKIPVRFRVIQLLDKFFRKCTSPTSSLDSRRKEYTANPPKHDRDYWGSKQYWTMEYERAHKFGLHCYAQTKETVKGKRILEIGGGLGGSLCAHKDQGASFVVGIELDKQRARFSNEYAENRTDTYFFVADGSRLPFKAGIFDLVLTDATFEHFQDPGSVLEGISRVLKPGALLGTFFGSPYHHQWHHSDYEFRIPWVDRLFGEKTVMDYLRWKSPNYPNKTLREFRGLNGLTIQTFRRFAKKAGLEEISFSIEGARRVVAHIPLGKIPWIRNIQFRSLPLGARRVPIYIYFPFVLPFPGHKKIFPGHYTGTWRKL